MRKMINNGNNVNVFYNNNAVPIQGYYTARFARFGGRTAL